MRAQNRKSMRAGLVVIILIAVVLIVTACMRPRRTYIRYINANVSSGVGNGTSWADAYRYLQDALAEASSDHRHNDYEIWVAKGVYYTDEGEAVTDNDRTASFRIEYDNIQLYGGFAGHENERHERDPATHVTILSGDIDQNDINYDGNFIAETWEDIQGNNAHHVIWLDGSTHEAITGDTVIDGFTITAGHAVWEYGGGIVCFGGGMDRECSPLLNNLYVMGNWAHWGGGLSFTSGSIVYDEDNHVVLGTDRTSRPWLNNSVISGNRAELSGGGIQTLSLGWPSIQLMITNVTLYGNSAQTGGALENQGVYFAEGWVPVNKIVLVNTLLSNCIDAEGHQIHNYYAELTINNSLVEGGDASIYDAEGRKPASIGNGNILLAPLFLDAENGNLRLTRLSPGVDAGDNSAVLKNVSVDLDGNPRIVDGTGDGLAVVDMGAYERSIPEFEPAPLPQLPQD